MSEKKTPKSKNEVRAIIIRAIGHTIATLANEPHYEMEMVEGGDNPKESKEQVSLALLCEVSPENVKDEFLASIPAAFMGQMAKYLDEVDGPVAEQVLAEMGEAMNIFAPKETKFSTACFTGEEDPVTAAEKLFGADGA